jgi:hypothetical protein
MSEAQRAMIVRHFPMLCVLLLGVLADGIADAADPRPNIVFILADDLGWTDLGCQGSKFYETPNIDRLAAAGMRFTDGYTCGPNCQPTRAALMSGQYSPLNGNYTVGATSRFDTSSRPLVPVENAVGLAPEKTTRRGPAAGGLRHRHVRQMASGQRRGHASRRPGL